MSIKLLCFALLKYILPLHADIFIVNKEHSPQTDASFQEMQSEQAVKKNVTIKLQVMSILFLIKFYKWKSDPNVFCEE